MLDLITVGNISADLYFGADGLTTRDGRFALAIGGKYRSSMFKMYVGGGGANVAIGAARHRLKTAVVGIVGNTVFRRSIIQRLQKAHVHTGLILFNQKDVNVSAVLLTSEGERTIISHQTSHRHVMKEKLILRKLMRTRAVYFGNVPDVSVAERNALMTRLSARDTKIFINLGTTDCRRPAEELSLLLEKADVLIVNTHEFADLVKKPLKSINFSRSVLHLLPVMKTKTVVVTDGANGSYGYNGEDVYHVPVVKTKTVDTTGVGDSYTSGFIAIYLRTEDIIKAMKAGTREASRNLATIGPN